MAARPTFFLNKPMTNGPAWGSRPGTIPGAIMLSRETFNQMDDAIEAMKGIPKAYEHGMNLLLRTIANFHKARAQAMTRGPMAPHGSAWTIPVRRVSQELYHGWRARQIRPGMWEMFNPVEHAWDVEHGVNPRATGQVVPRPVMKMSGLQTIRVLAGTQVGQRFSKQILAPLVDHRGRANPNTYVRIRDFERSLPGTVT